MNKLILIRHGMSMGNLDHRNYKNPDSAVCLCEKGIYESLDCAETLKAMNLNWSFYLGPIVYASAYYRAQQTARIVLDKLRLPHIQPIVERSLNERNYGPKPENEGIDNSKDPNFRYPGGESYVDTKIRVGTWFDRVAKPMITESDIILFFHAGSLRGLTAHILGLSDDDMLRVETKNAKPYVYEYTNGIWQKYN